MEACMKIRDNIKVEVSITVVKIDLYNSTNLASANKSVVMSMDTKQIGSYIKSLINEAKMQALEALDVLIARDDEEEAKKDKE